MMITEGFFHLLRFPIPRLGSPVPAGAGTRRVIQGVGADRTNAAHGSTGTLGRNPRSCKKPSVIIIAGKIQLYPQELYQQGMDIITVPTTRNLHSALNPAIKSLNYRSEERR